MANRLPKLSAPLSRRTLLRGAGGLALALPWLEAMDARASNHGAPKRLLVWYTPNGTVPANFWPTGGETDFVLSPILAPLEPHRDDLLILGNVDMKSSLSGPGDAHQKGTGQCLTARPLQSGNFAGDAGQSAGWADGISVDQQIAAQVGQSTSFQSLELGVMVEGSDVSSRISYRGAGQPVPPQTSPYDAYVRLFGDPDADSGAQQLQRARRQALMDRVGSDYRKLSGRLGARDREKLEIHIASIDEISQRLEKSGVEFGGACQPLDQGSALDPMRAANMPAIGRLQMDLLAMALACDMTRVGSLMWTSSAADIVYSWLGDDVKEGHHLLAHKGDEDTVKVEQNTRINTWYTEQFAYLIAALKAIPEGDGTVFDNTVILWTNEQAKGNNHDRKGMPYVLAGSAGGHFNTGRYVTQPDNVPHNRLLVSLLQAFGVETESFGDPEHGTGALSGLV